MQKKVRIKAIIGWGRFRVRLRSGLGQELGFRLRLVKIKIRIRSEISLYQGKR